MAHPYKEGKTVNFTLIVRVGDTRDKLPKGVILIYKAGHIFIITVSLPLSTGKNISPT